VDVLSTSAGSAQAVRDAAAASESAIDARLALERELDRLNDALGGHAAVAAQHLNWTLLAQAFLLTAYLIVLVGGWSIPLPGKHWLLTGIAAYGALSLALGFLSQRGSRDRIAPLRQSRRLIEQALERVAARPTVFSRERVFTTGLGDWATRLLPLVVLTGWAALTVYTLALPPASHPRALTTERAEPRTSAAPSATTRSRAPGRKAEETVAATAAPAEALPAEAGSEEESGLAALFRRAINTPAAPAQETIKP
jgi:hypothetical protein